MKTCKILIIGNHPINYNLKCQYQANGDDVELIVDYSLAMETDFNSYREVCLLADYSKENMAADNEIMELVKRVAMIYEPARHNGNRLLCHLLLRSQSLLRAFCLEGFRQELEEKLEIYPFTIEDQWGQMLAQQLDWEPIMLRTEKTVHLVIFRMNPIAELVAINAAHVCHYPNSLQKEHSLRTRITIIDEDIYRKSKEWISRYHNLFENSYYRFVDPQKTPVVTQTNPPKYRERESFVDIEWEFVSASSTDTLVRSKISQWAISPSQLLTIVFAEKDTASVLSEVLYLPEEVVSEHVPVYVYMENDASCQLIRQGGPMAVLRPFGMVNRGYDIHLPLVQMAKNVNYVYNKCRVMEKGDGTWKMEYAVEIDPIERDVLWRMLPFDKRMSSYYNALTVGVKMRSMGFQENEWEKFYDISQEEIEVLAQVEHNRWCIEELIMGWRPCDDKEQREVEADIHQKEVLKKRKIHYDLRAYNDLRPDASGKPVQIYDRCLSACIPLIAKESKGGKI